MMGYRRYFCRNFSLFSIQEILSFGTRKGTAASYGAAPQSWLSGKPRRDMVNFYRNMEESHGNS
jgi:hypothetical protein